MKTFAAALIAATMLTGPAMAWDYVQNGPGQQIGDNASGVQNNTSQRQGQAQGQRQTATGGNARATGGKSNVSVTNSVRSGGGGVGGGIGLTVPGGYGNAPCGGGIGLGGLGLSGGGSGGGTLWEFADCKRMRESSALLQLGFPDAALAELCQIDRVRDAFGGRCPGEVGAVMVKLPEPPVVVPAPSPRKHWATVPCHLPRYRDASGTCHDAAPKPKPAVEQMTCHDLLIETLRECHEPHHAW